MERKGHTAILGCQWGDEGKGRVVDLLAPEYDYVVRFNGGNNAGHTVKVGPSEEETYKFHLVPSGVLHPDVINVLGHGVVIDPEVLVQEIIGLRDKGIKNYKLAVSNKAHLIMPWHKINDSLSGGKIGTTGRGIGPCYGDRVGRRGLRVEDLVDSDGKIRKDHFYSIVRETLRREEPVILALRDHYLHPSEKRWAEFDNRLAKELYPSNIAADFFDFAETFAPFVRDTAELLYAADKQGKRILFEGAQGVMLDTDEGTYPYVTSSHPTVGGIYIGTGIAPRLDRVIGVVKAYTTRVGGGPFPTELTDEIGRHLQEKGKEFGTTTGRKRRCGWLDLVPIGIADRVNGLTEIAVTKLDVLSGLPSDYIKVRIPDWDILFNTWREDITQAKDYSDLPKEAQSYLKFISERTELPIPMISVGPERDAIIIRDFSYETA